MPNWQFAIEVQVLTNLNASAFSISSIEARRPRPIEGAAVLPRAALRTDDRVLVLGGDSRVFLRDVVVARRGSESIVVTAGLEDGERVVVSPLPIAADGMRVRVVAGPGAEVEQGS